MYKLYNAIKCLLLILNANNIYAFNIITSRRSLITNGLLLTNTNTNLNNRNEKIILNEYEYHNKYYNENNNENNNENHKDSQNKNFLSNNIYFNGQINEESCFQLYQALEHHKQLYFNEENYPNNINLFIQSPGGGLLPTLALIDEIKNFNVDIHTYIRGYAASAATLISVIGKKRFIYKNSLMMVHGVKLNEQTVSNVLEIKDLNYNVDLFMSIITDIYLENSNIDKKTLFQLFEHDIWLDSANALEYGFVDKIL